MIPYFWNRIMYCMVDGKLVKVIDTENSLKVN